MDGLVAVDTVVEVIINIRRLKRNQKIMVAAEEDNTRALASRVEEEDVVVMKSIFF